MSKTQPFTPPTWGKPGFEAPRKPADSRPLWKKKRVIIPAALLLLGGISLGEDPEGKQSATLAASEERTQEDQAAETAEAAAAAKAAEEAAAAEQAAATKAAEEAAAAKAAADAAAAAKAAEEAAAAQAAADAAAQQAAAQAVQQAAAEQAARDAATAQAAAAAPTSASYANCTEAKAAGAAPIYSGDPGYSRKLDRDGDGVACET